MVMCMLSQVRLFICRENVNFRQASRDWPVYKKTQLSLCNSKLYAPIALIKSSDGDHFIHTKMSRPEGHGFESSNYRFSYPYLITIGWKRPPTEEK